MRTVSYVPDKLIETELKEATRAEKKVPKEMCMAQQEKLPMALYLFGCFNPPTPKYTHESAEPAPSFGLDKCVVCEMPFVKRSTVQTACGTKCNVIRSEQNRLARVERKKDAANGSE